MVMEDSLISKQLPPGFRFSPTDEELVLHFLYPKALSLPNLHHNIIPELDPHLLHPWELDGVALLSGNQYLFFSKIMENKILKKGYWKQLDREESIFSSGVGKKIGVKKLFVFFNGEAETNWLMQEYHLCNWSSDNSNCCKWVVCRVEESSSRYSKEDDGTELSYLDEMFLSLDDDLEDISS